jgi:hypothetical protein
MHAKPEQVLGMARPVCGERFPRTLLGNRYLRVHMEFDVHDESVPPGEIR